MKKILILLTIALTSLVGYAQTKTWTNDAAHSRLGFVVKHLTISEINGRFADFSINVTTSKPDYSDAQIELTAKIASIDTEKEARDQHLKTADFFDAEKFPTLTFKSTSFQKVSDNKAKLTGNLTMHGVTKPVTLDVTYNGNVVNPMNSQETFGFKITGVLKRSEFGIGPNFPELVISDNIQIIANAEFSPNK